MFLLGKNHKMWQYSSGLPSMAVLSWSRSCVSFETQRALHVSSSHRASFTHLHYLHDPFGSNFLTFNFQLNPKLLLSHFSRVRLCATPQMAAHQAPPSWDSPGKNAGVGCHFLLQCMKVKTESEVTQSCPTLSDPMDCSLPGSSVHGIFQARVLE